MTEAAGRALRSAAITAIAVIASIAVSIRRLLVSAAGVSDDGGDGAGVGNGISTGAGTGAGAG